VVRIRQVVAAFHVAFNTHAFGGIPDLRDGTGVA
jgi:hypothetical protein